MAFLMEMLMDPCCGGAILIMVIGAIFLVAANL
jgi:hypothetical protein